VFHFGPLAIRALIFSLFTFFLKQFLLHEINGIGDIFIDWAVVLGILVGFLFVFPKEKRGDIAMGNLFVIGCLASLGIGVLWNSCDIKMQNFAPFLALAFEPREVFLQMKGYFFPLLLLISGILGWGLNLLRLKKGFSNRKQWVMLLFHCCPVKSLVISRKPNIDKGLRSIFRAVDLK